MKFSNHQIQELKHEMDPMRKREKELSELLEKTEEELKSIKAEVSQILVSYNITFVP
jgi:F0F1-type ATP synthase membrane subunit b/b'